jgi:hypothetical protein
MKARTSIIRVLVVITIMVLCVLCGTSCSSPSERRGNKPLTNIIKLYDYTVTTQSGFTIEYFCYAADVYDAQRIVDAKVSMSGFKSGNMKEIVPLNKPFAVFR